MPADRPVRVFLVEDHSWLLETQSRFLEMQEGIAVCGSATTAEAALDSLPDETDVVVTDMRLPGMSGIDLLRALAEQRPGVAGLIHSARPAVEVAAAARDAGAVAYVEKGDMAALIAAIHACRPAP